MVMGRDRRVVVYPTSDNTLLNFVCIHPTSESQIDAQEPGSSDWQNQGNIGKMLEVYKEFEPAVIKLLSMADEETLKVWELLDMEQLPSWTEGKLVLIGDAAHPFTPREYLADFFESRVILISLKRSRSRCRPGNRGRSLLRRPVAFRHTPLPNASAAQTLREMPDGARLQGARSISPGWKRSRQRAANR